MALPLSSTESGSADLRIVQDSNSTRDLRRASQSALSSRITLMTELQSTLDVSQLLSLFFRHCQQKLDIDGLRYQTNDRELELGSAQTHSLAYRLITRDAQLGELTVSRRRVFTASQIIDFENTLSTLLQPLNNALTHAAALKSARTDALTGIGNRSAMQEALEHAINTADRYRHPLSLLMIDIDNFKSVNDLHGHGMGDRILQAVVDALLNATRNTDQCFRLGGDEFVVILCNTPAIGGMVIAERIRDTIAALHLCGSNGAIEVTASIGVSTWHAPDLAQDLLEQADAAMYQVKRRGGDSSHCPRQNNSH